MGVSACVVGVVCGLDRAVQAWMQSPALQHDALLQGMAGLLNWWGGDGVVYCGVLLWIGARVANRRALALVGVRGLEALAVASAISGIIKGVAGRARPFVAPGEPWQFSVLNGWTDAHYFSLPSGHTTATMAFAIAICMVTLGASRWLRAIIGGLLVVSALLVACARMYTDQHWATDVLFGALLGGTVSWWLTRWHLRHGDSAFDRALAGRSATV